MAKKTDKPNKSNALTVVGRKDNEPAPVEPEDRMVKLARILCQPGLDLPLNKAAELAGYGPGYANSNIYQTVRNPKFQQILKECVLTQYKTNSIPRILNIDNKVLGHLVENPLEAPKFAATLKRISKIAGYLNDETPHVVQTINFNSIRQSLRNFIERDDTVDVEPEG
jgi:hypothetical protein